MLATKATGTEKNARFSRDARFTKNKVLWPATIAALGMLAGCATGHNTGSAVKNGSTTTKGLAKNVSQSVIHRPAPWPHVHVQVAGQLPLGVVGNALAVDPHKQLVSAGGYTGVYSVDTVSWLGKQGASVGIPARTHDAAAGFIGSNLYMFGGGQATSYDTIVRVTPSGSSVSGYLKRPLSDAVSVPYTMHGQHGLLLFGGYDGQVFNTQASFVTVKKGQMVWKKAFVMPEGLRYTAVATAKSTVYYTGGELSQGGLGSTVYAWKAGQAKPRVIAKLPHGIEKAAAFTYDGFLILAGGLDTNGNPTSAIVAMRLTNGAMHTIGHLPGPRADMGYTQVGANGYLAGGMVSSSVANPSRVVYRLQFK